MGQQKNVGTRKAVFHGGLGSTLLSKLTMRTNARFGVSGKRSKNGGTSEYWPPSNYMQTWGLKRNSLKINPRTAQARTSLTRGVVFFADFVKKKYLYETSLQLQNSLAAHLKSLSEYTYMQGRISSSYKYSIPQFPRTPLLLVTFMLQRRFDG